MSRSRGTQSAIQDVRDQLFLDWADGAHLNVVGNNLGLDRPAQNLSDDEWRYAIKQLAVQPKLIPNAFRRVMEVCLGPQHTRLGTLAQNARAGDTVLELEDASELLQLGELTLSPGQTTEEVVRFCFRDFVTNRVYLTSALQWDHDTREAASTRLTANAGVGATSLSLDDTSQFPITGFPYSVILDRGTPVEEVVRVSANDTTTDTLTCTATVYAHAAPKARFVRKALAEDVAAGRTFIRLGADATRVLPTTGFVRLAYGTGTEEVVEFVENDVQNAVLWLKRPLANAHTAGESVELTTPGASAELLSCLQAGVGWNIHETEPRRVKITVPDIDAVLTNRDVSYLHDVVPAAHSTTLAVGTSASDTTIEVNDISGFPDEAGLILIDGTVTRFYVLRDEGANQLKLTREVGAVYSSGTTVSLVRHVHAGTTDLEDGNLRDSSGALQGERWPGPYLFDVLQDNVTSTVTALDEFVPPPAYVAVDQLSGRTNIEVFDAGFWPAPPFSSFQVRIGGGTGFSETRTVTDRTLREDATTTLDVGASAGDSTIALVDSTAFPESDGINIAGYRVILDEGGANEEIVTVRQNTAGTPGTFTLEGGLANNHSGGETVALLYDVLTVDALTEDHAGPSFSPSQRGHRVAKVVETLTVANASALPSSGRVWLNFGRGRISQRQKLATSAGSGGSTLQVPDSSKYPTTDFPYPVRVGEGRVNEEQHFVTANDTGLNELTISGTLAHTHGTEEYVSYESGAAKTIDYVGKDGNDLELPPNTTFATQRTKGEAVNLSTGVSLPNREGYGYAFLLPPSSTSCIEALTDLARSAGVQVKIIEQD